MNTKTTNNGNSEPVLFELGSVQVSALAAGKVADHGIRDAIARHERGDFGRVGLPSRIIYRQVIRASRGSIMSLYDAASGAEFAVVTDLNKGTTGFR